MAVPCVCCKTEGGIPHPVRGRNPARFDGARYRFDGVICSRCRARFYQRQWRAGVRDRQSPPPHAGWEPTPEEIAASARMIRERK